MLSLLAESSRYHREIRRYIKARVRNVGEGGDWVMLFLKKKNIHEKWFLFWIAVSPVSGVGPKRQKKRTSESFRNRKTCYIDTSVKAAMLV